VPSIPIDLKDLQDMHIRDVSWLCRSLFPINDVLAFPCRSPRKKSSSTHWRFAKAAFGGFGHASIPIEVSLMFSTIAKVKRQSPINSGLT
jgi:hypothetical protein